MTSKLISAASSPTNSQSKDSIKFVLPSLPYSHDALEPIISKQTVDFHWGKHVQVYVNNLNKLIIDTEFERAGLEDICAKATGGIHNNGAQVWNHIFYFEAFSDKAQQTPTGDLLDAINRDFQSFDNFKTEFESKSLRQFGSGWVWLVKDDKGYLSIVAMPNADNPIKNGITPLFVADVWEHAYYLDYQNRRGDHIKNLWKIVDWNVIERRFLS